MLANSDTDTDYATRGAFRPFLLHRSMATKKCFRKHPALPVLPATRLQLDLLLGNPNLDLQAILVVILNDIGATLQLWREASRKGNGGERRIGRIEDCIIHLGRSGLRHATATTFSVAGRHSNQAEGELWTRARLTAEFSRTIADRVPTINPSDAYLAGLLHEAGRLPALLGWNSTEIDVTDTAAVGRAIAEDWELPAFVGPTFLLSSSSLQASSRLCRVVAIAWEMSNAICNGHLRPRKPLLPAADQEEDSPLEMTQTRSASAALRLVRVK